MTDLPDNVDLQWLGRQFLAMRQELRDLKTDVRHIREDLDIVAMRVIRIDAAVTALRDDIRTLWEEYGDLRRRVEALENK
jgi:chromosome segregation ATPase